MSLYNLYSGTIVVNSLAEGKGGCGKVNHECRRPEGYIFQSQKRKTKPERDVPHPLCHISLRLVFFSTYSTCVGPSEVFLACSTLGNPKKLSTLDKIEGELTEKFMKGPVWCFWPVVLKMSLRTLTFNFG